MTSGAAIRAQPVTAATSAPNLPGTRAARVPGTGRLVRQVVREVPVPLSGLAPAEFGRRWLLVTDDGQGVAPALVRRLATRDIVARVTGDVAADVTAHDDGELGGLVFLGGLRKINGADEAIKVNREAFAVARAVAAWITRRGGMFVTVQDTGGDFGLHGRQGDRAWLGGVAALARTVAKEWPRAVVKAIDCERAGRDAERVADALADELCLGGTLMDVGLRADGRRITLVAEAEPVPVPVAQWRTGHTRPALLLRPGSVIVATGGARGITAAAVHALARAHRPRLVLIGRTPLDEEPAPLRAAPDEMSLRGAIVAELRKGEGRLPAPADIGERARRVLAAREIRRTLAALARLGGEVRYLPVDVRDTRALARALDRLRGEWGPLTGLIHGAGVLADAPVEGKTTEMFDRVFDVKVSGLQSLLAATEGDPLAFVYLFSSFAAQFGNAGQSDYAMANEVLFQVAAAETWRRPDRPVTAVGWGPWEAGMVTPELAGHFQGDGVGLVPVEEGGRAVLATLAAAVTGRRILVAADGDRVLSGRGGHRRAALDLDLERLPQLRDHVVAGVPVLPMAFAIDRFAAAVTDLDPALPEIALADLKVFRKVTVEHGRPRRLTLTVEERPDGMELRLLDEEGRPCQAARRVTVTPGERYVDWTPPTGLEPLAHPDPYASDTLFHGPAFHALRSVDGMAVEGAAGEVAGVLELGWPHLYPHTDPAAVDGALQLALLWAQHVLRAATLPMGARLVRLRAAGPLPGISRCVLRGRRIGADHAVCDVALLERHHGRTHVELLGLSLIRRP